MKSVRPWSIALIALAACSGGSQSSQGSGTTSGSQTQTSGSSGEQSTQASDASSTAQSSQDASATQASAGDGSASDGGAAQPVVDLPPMPTGLHGPPTPWAQMNAHDKGHYMGEAIVPNMRALFHAYDATNFASANCATCHGANARAVNFHMPNTLPSLPAFGTDASNRLMAEQPRMFAFMSQRVVPTMAQLLGEQPYDPQTHQGFGCFNCHPHAP